MTTRRSPWPIVTGIIAVLCLIIALPSSWKPWLPAFLKPELHLGLDLAGGTQLDFRISEDEITAREKSINQDIDTLKGTGNDNTKVLSKQLELRSVQDQHASLVEAIRNVLERRINSLGVSEATITPSYIGTEKHLLVECPGVIDVQKCIQTVGKTIQLEFKEEFNGKPEDYQKGVTDHANKVFADLSSGSGTLQKTGQDLSTTLGVNYVDSHPYFRNELSTSGLMAFWDRKPSDPPVKIDGTVRVVAQNAQGAPELHDIKGIYVGQVVEGRKQVTHAIDNVPDSMDALQKASGGAAVYAHHTGENLETQNPGFKDLLTSMQPGDHKVAAGSPTESSVLYLLSRVPGTQEMTASHLLVQYKGAQRADPGVTRTKEEALKRATELKTRLDKGEDFVKLTKAESDGPSKADGGSLGVIKPGQTAAPFEQAAFALKQGEVSAVVETPFGFHIIRADVPAHSATTTVTYDELTYKGDGAQAKTKDADDKIEKKAMTITEDQLTLRTLFFSLQPTGWQDTTLNGQRFRSASVSTDPVSGIPVVQIQFDDEGATLFQQLTKRNIGKRIAIFVGGDLVSAPTVNTEISGGHAVITGSRTLDEARNLALDLNTGAIPAPIYLSGQSTIEATLGLNALQQSIVAGIIGLVVLGLFMIVIYRGLGLMADLALIFYVLLMLALLKLPVLLVSSQHIVLTLAGIAGIILSIGMAVDANVLAFERFKEEVHKGKMLKTAVETGFNRAWPSVRDGNVSTLITCSILFIIGTSIIRGFSVTLALGIFCSLFTAIIVTRYLVRHFINLPITNRPELFGVKKERADQ